jgi:hypothetical protein
MRESLVGMHEPARATRRINKEETYQHNGDMGRVEVRKSKDGSAVWKIGLVGIYARIDEFGPRAVG